MKANRGYGKNATEPNGSVDKVADIGWESRQGANLDHEKAILLRSIVLPILDGAETWTALKDALEDEGFGVVIHSGRLMLTDRSSGRRICTGRFLGKPLTALVARLGKPHVRLGHGNTACGEILC